MTSEPVRLRIEMPKTIDPTDQQGTIAARAMFADVSRDIMDRVPEPAFGRPIRPS